MTDKAEAVLRKIRQRQALKQWKRLNNPGRRDQILDEFNQSTLDDVRPVQRTSGDKFWEELDDERS